MDDTDDVCHVRMFVCIVEDKCTAVRMTLRQSDGKLVPFITSNYDGRQFLPMIVGNVYLAAFEHHIDMKHATHIALRLCIGDMLLHSALHVLQPGQQIIVPFMYTKDYTDKQIHIDGVFFNMLSYTDTLNDGITCRGRRVSGSEFVFDSMITTLSAVMDRYVDIDDEKFAEVRDQVIKSLQPVRSLPCIFDQNEVRALVSQARRNKTRVVTTEL